MPDDIRPLVGMVEVRRSLRTYEPFRARVQSAVYAARLLEVFAMLRKNQDTLTPADVKAMITACFREMVVDAVNCTPPFGGTPVPVSVAATQDARGGLTLAEAINTYLTVKRPTWTGKTYESRFRRLSYLREYLGGEIAISSVTVNDIRAFRDAVCRFRRQQGRSRAENFAARQTENTAHRIDAKTAVLILEPIKAFMRWCKSEQGYIVVNPAEDIRVSVPKRTKGNKSRRPFTAGELTQLFSAPVFTGCLSRSRRFDRGGLVIRDAKFWVPVLGYYTGARMGELVQLHIADICTEEGVVFVRVTEEVAGPPGTADIKHVKSDAGIRRIPLHDDLLALGFLAFVEKRRQQQRRGSKRLFSEVKFGSDGQASTVFSKWFGRLMDKAGLGDPSLVFHSLRHNAEDAFRDALQPQYVIDRVIGHSDGATSALYGEGASLPTLKSAVDAMRLKVRLPISSDGGGGA